jgi:hypothetical protein
VLQLWVLQLWVLQLWVLQLWVLQRWALQLLETALQTPLAAVIKVLAMELKRVLKQLVLKRSVPATCVRDPSSSRGRVLVVCLLLLHWVQVDTVLIVHSPTGHRRHRHYYYYHCKVARRKVVAVPSSCWYEPLLV